MYRSLKGRILMLGQSLETKYILNPKK